MFTFAFGLFNNVPLEVLSRTTSSEGSNTATHSVTMPATVNSGDLLLTIFVHDGSDTVSWDTFTEIKDMNDGSEIGLAVGYKQAAGTEGGGSETVTTSGSQTSAHITYRIIGHKNPSVQAPEVSTGATGTSSTPDPDALTPTGGSKEYLWIAALGRDIESSVSSNPTNYTNGQEQDGGTGAESCFAASAERILEASSENPGTFTVSSSQEWCAVTIAVHPA